MATAPHLLSTSNQDLIPKNISESIWEKAIQASVIQDLLQEEPMSLGDNVFGIATGNPTASIVGEGEGSKGSRLSMTSKTIRPITAQVIVELSKNALAVNADRLSDQAVTKIGQAVGKQMDLAVFHGVDATTGLVLPGASFINQAANRVTVDFSVKNPDQFLWDGYGLMVNQGHAFDGLALDPRYIFQLANARDTQGRRLNPEIDMGAAVKSYNGQRLVSSYAISGQVDGLADNGVRGFGGDWSSVKFGIAEDIKIHTQTSGDPLGNGDLEARRMVAIHATVQFGWTLLDPTALVAYELAPSGE